MFGKSKTPTVAIIGAGFGGLSAAITLQNASMLPGPWLVPYLNRLADVLWVLARAAEQAEQRAATLARSRPSASA